MGQKLSAAGLVNTATRARRCCHACCRDAARYSQFLGIAGEDKNIEESASGLKNRGDPVTNTLAPDSRQESQEIGDSKAQGTPADRYTDGQQCLAALLKWHPQIMDTDASKNQGILGASWAQLQRSPGHGKV